MIKHLICLTLYILLSGCAEMNSQFDCPMKGGVSCLSLDEVNAKVDRGEIGTPARKCIRCKSNIVYTPHLQTFSSAKSASKPKRKAETVQHIWIAPFEDTAGNFHEDSDIYTVIKPGAWLGYPVKAVGNNEE